MDRHLLQTLIKHESELKGFMYSFLRSGQDAEDLFQEVAMVVVEKNPDPGVIKDPYPWIREIARRTVLAHLRAKKRKAPTAEMERILTNSFFPAEQEESEEELFREREALRDCLRRMRPHHRELVHERFVLGRSLGEMAKLRSKQEGALRRMVSRVRQALFACVRRELAVRSS